MRITVVRLRRGILILGGLLVAILIGFLTYAHYRLRRFEHDLPARLGVNIQQTANGYTYSQSSGGHTLFTIHASKLIQFRRGGNAALHDVSITLYGPPGSKRTDKIYGANFDYDAKDQIIRAQGAVEIDLQGLGSGTASAANTIHVKTSGLVFNQKTGEADTSQYTEFAFPKASGNATGAHYDSRTGVLTLDSRVNMKTLDTARPVTVAASHAVLLRAKNEALLTQPQTIYQAEHGSADSAVVDFRADGTAQSIHADGHVQMTTADGAVVTASNSVTNFNAQGQPLQTNMNGGVTFASTTPKAIMHGTAASGVLFFGANSALRRAEFRQNVRYASKVYASGKKHAVIASRRMTASVLDVNFASRAKGRRIIAQTALATGNASLELNSTPLQGTPQHTTIRADQLRARFTPDGRTVRQLNGTGHTELIDVGQGGSTNTSTGDTLQVVFRAPAAGAKRGSTASPMQIVSAVQSGQVVSTQTPQPKPGTPVPATMTAWAQRAAYDASTQQMRLTGNPRLYDGQSLQLSAISIDFHRDTGTAEAIGDVKATYTQTKAQPASAIPTLGGEGPVHITASRALLRRASGLSMFYGSHVADARMWQGADTILAPVIELAHSPETLVAHGAPGNRGAVVEAILTSTNPASHQPSAMRIHSHTLRYSESDRRASFRGDVTATDANGVIHADETDAYLTPASQPPTQLDRIVATGHVVLVQPGRTGTGSKLVYTASSEQYVLTGTPARPPRIVDAAHGTTTGAALIFNGRNDSVLVSGGPSSAVTMTRAPH